MQGFLQAPVRDLRVVFPESRGWSMGLDRIGLLDGGVLFLAALPFPRHLDIEGQEEGGRWSLETRAVQMPTCRGPVMTGPPSRPRQL